MDTILEILETIKPGADFASSTDFIEEHLLESMEILQLVSELNDEFDIISRFLILSQRTLSLWKAFTTWFRKF